MHHGLFEFLCHIASVDQIAMIGLASERRGARSWKLDRCEIIASSRWEYLSVVSKMM